MRLAYTPLIAAFLSCSSGLAAPGDGLLPDSLQAFTTLPEIVVTATRTPASSVSVYSTIHVLSRAQLEARPGSLLSAAMETVPGVVVRSYGGGASLQTLSLRGMAPEHTLVLIDGERTNSFQNGLVDFGLLNSSDIERVEVAKGGYSALYGSDAIGGVVNVVTRPAPEKFSAAFSASVGSERFSANELSLGTAAGVFAVRARLRREQGRGDYLFTFDDGRSTTELRRTGNDFSILTADLRGDAAVAGGVRCFAGISYTDADRGSPGVVTDVFSAGKARLADQTLGVRGRVEWDIDTAVTLRLNVSARSSRESFIDPRVLIQGSTVQSEYENRVFTLSPEARFTMSPGWSGVAGVEYARGGIASDEITEATRIQRSAYLSMLHTIPFPWETPFEVILYPSIRYDTYSDVEGAASPKLGVNIGFMKEPGLRLRASYGRSFRAPVFNDLYWKAGGNPELRPERSTAFDAGVRLDISFGGLLRVDASYYSIDARDRIVWIPGAGGLWSPRNIAAVRSRGVEAEASWTGFDGAVTLTINSAWTEVTKTSADFPADPTQGKFLIYVPRQTFGASALVRIWGAEIVLQQTWYSYRYTTEINDRFLPHYAIAAGAVRYVLPAGPLRLTFKGEVNNIFNSSYQVIALYPMPLREFRGTLGVEL